MPKENKKFDVINTLTDEERDQFLETFALWLAESPEFPQSLSSAQPEVRNAIESITRDEKGDAVSQKSVSREYYEFLAQTGENIVNTLDSWIASLSEGEDTPKV